MNCPNCGFEAMPGETVCLACGQPLTGVKKAETSSVSVGNSTFAVANGNQTYDVVLKNIGANKIAIIKVVKETLGLGLAEAKETVEAKGVVATNMSQDEAEAFILELRANGATAELCEAGEHDEGLYDVTVVSYTDKESALRGVIQFTECDEEDAELILQEGLLGVEISHAEAQDCARIMKEYGVEVAITESEIEETDSAQTQNATGNKPAVIGFVLSIIGLLSSFISRTAMLQMMSSSLLTPAVILGIVGAVKAGKGAGKKGLVILTFVFVGLSYLLYLFNGAISI